MPDSIGRIAVPSVTLSTGGAGLQGTQIFPLLTQPPFGVSVARAVITHRFGSPRRQAGAAILRRHWPAHIPIQAAQPQLERVPPTQGVLGIHAGAMEGVHLQRAESG